MSNDYTHVSIILDRTGSMSSIRDDVIGGFNTFLAKQKQEEGRATLTLVQFDSQDPYEVVHAFRDIHVVPELTRATFVPRASTPLYDAIGRGIHDLEKSLGALPTKERPDNVMVVVITDGQENASQEFNREQVRKLMDGKKEQGWQFVFLSADMNALDEAEDVGFDPSAAMYFAGTAAGTASAFDSLSAGISSTRSGRRSRLQFEREEREKARRKK